MKKIIFSIIALLLVAIPVSAAVIKKSDIYEHKVGSTIFDDLYAVGGVLSVSGNVAGDVISVGGEVSVAGDVAEDILIAGGDIDLSGVIGGDIRAVGGEIVVSNNVAEDVVVAGGVVRILSSSVIGGDVIVASGFTSVSGVVKGDLTIYGDEVLIDGSVAGNVVINFANKVTISSDAVISGDLIYSAKKEIEIPEGAFIGGEITFNEPKSKKGDFNRGIAGIIGVLFAIKFMSLLIASVVTVLVFKKFSKIVGKNTFENFAKNTLVGFIVMVVVSVSSVLLIISIFGMSIGFILIGACLLLLFISKIFAAIVAGAVLSKWFMKDIIVDWKWTLLGAVSLKLVWFIPVLGQLVGVVFVVASYGAIATILYQKMWLKR